MPHCVYYPDDYRFEHRLAGLSNDGDLPPENDRDSIEAILQRLADFPLPEDESEDK